MSIFCYPDHHSTPDRCVQVQAVDPLQTQRSTWETELLKAIRDAVDDYAGQTIMEDRNQEPHKIFGVQESPDGTSEAADASNLLGPS